MPRDVADRCPGTSSLGNGFIYLTDLQNKKIPSQKEAVFSALEVYGNVGSIVSRHLRVLIPKPKAIFVS